MFNFQTVYFGIDPTAGKKPFSYAVLNQNLSLQALGEGSMEAVLADVAAQHQVLVAVCAPQRPNQRLLEKEEVRQRFSPPPRPGRWLDFRVVEYQLRQHNIQSPRTPAQENACPGWMKKGFVLYHRLEKLNIQPYTPAQTSHQYLEVYPHACYTVLLGHPPLLKHSLEGRLQRQLVLHKLNPDIPDPMSILAGITPASVLQGNLPLNKLYQTGELDALVAAYTAWLAATHPHQVTWLGDPHEGYLVLPTSELKRYY